MAQHVPNACSSVVVDKKKTNFIDTTMYVVEANAELLAKAGMTTLDLTAKTLDAAKLKRVIDLIGLKGRASLSKIGSKTYAIIKGKAGLRPNLPGTRYLGTNPKVADLVISGRKLGKKAIGLSKSLKIISSVGSKIIEHIFANEQRTLMDLFGDIAVDFIKLAVVAGAGFLAGLAVGAFTTLVIPGMIAGWAMSELVGYGWDYADKRWNINDKILKAIHEVADEMENAGGIVVHAVGRAAEKVNKAVEKRVNRLASEMAKWERQLKYRAIDGSYR